VEITFVVMWNSRQIFYLPCSI